MKYSTKRTYVLWTTPEGVANVTYASVARGASEAVLEQVLSDVKAGITKRYGAELAAYVRLSATPMAARDCRVCGGDGYLIWQDGDCPYCQGSGKEQ